MSKTLQQRPDRIFIDATYTIGSGKSSGIERVVRSLLRECETLADAGRIPRPRLVVSHGGEFFEVDEAYVAALKKTAAMQANVLATAPAWYRQIARCLVGLTKSRKLHKWLLPQPGHLGLFKLPHTFRESSALRKLARTTSPVTAGSRDLFLLPDAYWINRLRHSVWPAAARARRRGAAVTSIIYDLIPVTHPEFVGLKRQAAFIDYIKKAARNSDLLVAISETVRRQLCAYLRQIQKPSDHFCSRIQAFRLGAELRVASGSIRPEVRELFSQSKTPYLTVATFDPRKNHSYLLDAFELLWKSEPEVQLCLVGRIGSRCDDIITRITQHPRLGQQLHLFDDLSDAELHHCYQRARGVVFPSIVEGFGLPIVESLWFGKKTFVSDTAIHREVGQEDCCYFQLDSPQSLADALSGWEGLADQAIARELSTRQTTSWQDSCEQLLSHCLDAYSLLSSPSSPAQDASVRRVA